jgi:(2Fe-2S) ferredoxin
MGGTRWSDEHYKERATYRAVNHVSTFAYSDDVKSGKTEEKAHNKLDPKDVKFRESCDSDVHPNSRAVAVLLDVTGSMSVVPKIVQENLPKLMGLLLRKGYLDHPHILIGAVGDAANPDKVPLQVGQFEAGIEIENDLTNLYLEGGGGGGSSESYELGMYFIARHTKMDCFDKRGEKGYLFIIGDEMPYKKVKRAEVERIIGDKLQADIPVEELVQELEKKYHVFFIIPNMTNHYNDNAISDRWKELLNQNVIKLDDPAGIAELIAATVGVNEGKVDVDDLEDDLKEAGATKSISNAVSGALVPMTKGKNLSKKAKGTDIAVPDSGAASGVATV